MEKTDVVILKNEKAFINNYGKYIKPVNDLKNCLKQIKLH